MLPAAPPSCPQCGQLDQTRKVSAIYDAETGWTIGPHGGGVRTQSRLAARLEPPKRPAARSCLTRLFGLILFVLVALTGGCAVLGWLISSLTGDTSLSLVPVIGGPPLLALLLVSSVALPWRVWERNRIRARLGVWEAQMAAWEQRFYCRRCDDTFIPAPVADGAYTGQTIRWTT